MPPTSLGYPFGPMVKLLILTGQRREEVAAMTRDEIVGDLWTIPKERAKNGVVHQVPLSPQARAIIDALPGEHPIPVHDHRGDAGRRASPGPRPRSTGWLPCRRG